MDVKSRVVTKIDDLLAEYNEDRERLFTGIWTEAEHNEILGSIYALEELKESVETLKVDKNKTMRIIHNPDSRQLGFLGNVIRKSETVRDTTGKRGSPGISSREAVRGRKEACECVIDYVYQLDGELVDCE